MAHVIEEPLQLSPNTMDGTATLAEHKLVVFDTEIFAGQVMVGCSVSFTVTVKLHCAVCKEASVTVTVTVVSPTLNVFVPGWPFPLRVVAPLVVQAIDEPVQLSLKEIGGMVTLAEQLPVVLLAV